MAKFPRAEAEEIAAQVVEALRPLILQTVTNMLAEEDDDGLTPQERARVDRTVATLARKTAGVGGARRAGRPAG